MLSLCLILILFLMPVPHLTSLNHSSLVTDLHLKTIRLVGVESLTEIIKPSQTKIYRSAHTDERILQKMDFRLSVDPACGQATDDAGLAHCASGIRDAPCDAVVQAGKFQGRDDADVVVTAADNQEPRIFWNGGLHP